MTATDVVATTVRGIDMTFMGYTRSLALCARMNYETENLDFIDGIPPGEVLYDLGACEGRFSIYAALKGVRVVAFEPERRNHQAFLENVAANGVSAERLRILKIAIGAEAGQARLKIGQPWAGGHQKVIEQPDVRQDLAFDFVEEEIVETLGVDEARDRFGLPEPAYLKVDIDGSEMPFLRGASRTLASPALKRIIFELETRDAQFPTIIGLLGHHGFTETRRYQVPNEPFLYNIVFDRAR